MLANRVRAIPESATLALNARAKALRAAGHDIASFAAGELDFPLPEPIRGAMVAALDRGETRYTDSSGTPELRAAIAEKTLRENGLRYDAKDIVVSCGAKHAIYNAIQVLCERGDEVLIPSPFWLSYPEMARLAEATPRSLACDPVTHKLSPETLRAAIGERSRVLVMNSPSNPTGAVYTREELAALGEVLLASPHVSVISDEIYEKLLYDGARHHSIAAVVPGLQDRTITVNGVSKSHAMTGLRIGWACGPREVMSALGRLQSHSTSNPATISQAGALAALRMGDQALGPWLAELDARRNLMVARLGAIRGIACPAPRGAFYCFASIEGLRGETIGGRRIEGAADFSEAALETSRVVLVPGESFGSAWHVRLSFATSRAEIERGLDRLAALVGRR